MSIIFLDIDGVLNTFECPADPVIPQEAWTPALLAKYGIKLNLNSTLVKKVTKLAQDTHSRIVITSSWRKGDNLHWLNLKAYLNNAGLQFIIDRTPDLASTREAEIIAWRSATRNKENFVILDDYDEFVELHNNFVQTVHSIGITDKDILSAKQILGYLW